MAWRPRLVSMPIISMIWRRRPTSSARWTLSGSRRGRACGRTRSAKRAITSASSVSVLAKRPIARAKSRLQGRPLPLLYWRRLAASKPLLRRSASPAPSGSLDYAVSLDGPPCMSELPAELRPARLRVEASPRPPGARKPEIESGAVSTTAVPHPDSRSGPSPHLQGRVMDEQRTVFVGIDVSKDRLDIHLRPSGEAFCVPREGKGKDDLVIRPWPGVGSPLCVVNPRQIRRSWDWRRHVQDRRSVILRRSRRAPARRGLALRPSPPLRMIGANGRQIRRESGRFGMRWWAGRARV